MQRRKAFFVIIKYAAEKQLQAVRKIPVLRQQKSEENHHEQFY